jgi:hypothetical protein
MASERIRRRRLMVGRGHSPDIGGPPHCNGPFDAPFRHDIGRAIEQRQILPRLVSAHGGSAKQSQNAAGVGSGAGGNTAQRPIRRSIWWKRQLVPFCDQRNVADIASQPETENRATVLQWNT